jgi:hypothetical protein
LGAEPDPRGDLSVADAPCLGDFPLSAIVIADLTGWRYRPGPGQVVVDSVPGPIAFGRWVLPRRGVRVSYHHAVPDDLGGGESPRLPVTPADVPIYRVGVDADARIN